jgi:hypothetical protein
LVRFPVMTTTLTLLAATRSAPLPFDSEQRS